MATLQGKTALVTGASRGIGRVTASALAEAGPHVLVHYGRSAQEAESLVAGIHAKGGRADAIKADLGTPDGATLLAREVRSIVGDRLDVLVLNAGISKAATIDHTLEDFDSLFATNVRSPFFLVQQLLPILGEGSNIIVISSIGARAVVGKPSLDNPSILAYASTKAHCELHAVACQSRDQARSSRQRLSPGSRLDTTYSRDYGQGKGETIRLSDCLRASRSARRRMNLCRSGWNRILTNLLRAQKRTPKRTIRRAKAFRWLFSPRYRRCRRASARC